jgi:hypothetical protein
VAESAGSQDRLDIALGADTSGLDTAEARSLAFVDRITRSHGPGRQESPPTRHQHRPAPGLAHRGRGVRRPVLLRAPAGHVRGAGGDQRADLSSGGQGIAAQATGLSQALARAGDATRALAAQAAEPVVLNTQPAISAADTLIAKLGSGAAERGGHPRGTGHAAHDPARGTYRPGPCWRARRIPGRGRSPRRPPARRRHSPASGT